MKMEDRHKEKSWNCCLASRGQLRGTKLQNWKSREQRKATAASPGLRVTPCSPQRPSRQRWTEMSRDQCGRQRKWRLLICPGGCLLHEEKTVLDWDSRKQNSCIYPALQKKRKRLVRWMPSIFPCYPNYAGEWHITQTRINTLHRSLLYTVFQLFLFVWFSTSTCCKSKIWGLFF